jgi:uncharacterized integral membrane protein
VADPPPPTRQEQRDPPRSTAPRQRGARFYVTIALIVLSAIFILQNTQKVEVKFLFSTATIGLLFALLLAALLGFLIGLAFPRLRRHDD